MNHISTVAMRHAFNQLSEKSFCERLSYSNASPGPRVDVIQQVSSGCKFHDQIYFFVWTKCLVQLNLNVEKEKSEMSNAVCEALS